MDTAKLRKQAQEQAKNFLENESEYRMGYIEAELPHPLTRKLSQTYAESTEKGVAMLLSVDAEMAGRAKELLLSSDTKVYAIAQRVGYKNVDYFHIKFKKIVNMSPAEFRKEHLGK